MSGDTAGAWREMIASVKRLTPRALDAKETKLKADREAAISEWQQATTPEAKQAWAIKHGYGDDLMRQQLAKTQEPKYKLKSSANDIFPGATAVWERSDGALVSVEVPASGVVAPPSDDAPAQPSSRADAPVPAAAAAPNKAVSDSFRARASKTTAPFAEPLNAVADALDAGEINIGARDPMRHRGMTGAEVREQARADSKQSQAIEASIRQKANGAQGTLDKMAEAQSIIDGPNAPTQGTAGQLEAFARTYTTNLFGNDPEMAKRSLFEQIITGPQTLAARGDKESGAFLAGAVSDRDMAFMRSMAPNLAGSRIATSAGVEATVNIAKRAVAHQQVAAMFKAKGLTLGGEDYIAAVEAVNNRIPLLSEETKSLMGGSPEVVEAYNIGGRDAARRRSLRTSRGRHELNSRRRTKPR